MPRWKPPLRRWFPAAEASGPFRIRVLGRSAFDTGRLTPFVPQRTPEWRQPTPCGCVTGPSCPATKPAPEPPRRTTGSFLGAVLRRIRTGSIRHDPPEYSGNRSNMSGSFRLRSFRESWIAFSVCCWTGSTPGVRSSTATSRPAHRKTWGTNGENCKRCIGRSRGRPTGRIIPAADGLGGPVRLVIHSSRVRDLAAVPDLRRVFGSMP